MATFSIKKTGMNITAWEYYVQNKEDWIRYKNLKVEIPSSTSNLPILYKDNKGKDTIGSPLKNGTPLELLSNQSFIIDGKIHAKVKTISHTGYLPITRLGKPTKDTTKDENIALKQLNSAIKKRNMHGKGPGICIIVKNRRGQIAHAFKHAIGAKTINGTPKADFKIIGKGNIDLAFISHKKEGGAKAYQQYVSVTGGKIDGINDSPVLQNALKKIASKINNITEERKRYKVTLPFSGESKTLILKSIYGMNYGKNFGEEHVHFIGQGTPMLKEANSTDRPKDCSIVYELTFSDDISLSGDLTHFRNQSYQPVILARYTSGRNFYVEGQQYTGARILIAPDALSATATEI